ncbi:hypothetical protein AB9K34_18350 [Sedimentitalea sp. XS_ASV28]|uniref:hypothetical protein n=1 Tax=Sedimentitalea sp. XS_ASV28 TaxID=3241296 RepID=UPI00351285D3
MSSDLMVQLLVSSERRYGAMQGRASHKIAWVPCNFRMCPYACKYLQFNGKLALLVSLSDCPMSEICSEVAAEPADAVFGNRLQNAWTMFAFRANASKKQQASAAERADRQDRAGHADIGH